MLMPTLVGPRWIFLSFFTPKNPQGSLWNIFVVTTISGLGYELRIQYVYLLTKVFYKTSEDRFESAIWRALSPKNIAKFLEAKHIQAERWDGCHNQATSPKFTSWISDFFVFLEKVWWGNAKFKWMFLDCPSDLCNEYLWIESTSNRLDWWGHDDISLSPSYVHQISE